MAGEQGGLLAFLNTPEGQGLLAGAFGGLAGARRGQPINSIGRAGMAGLQGYTNAQDQQQKLAQDAQRTKLFDAQMQGHQADVAAKQAALQQQQSRQNYLGSVGKVTSPMIGAAPNQFDPMAWLSRGGSVDEAKALATSKDWGAPEVARTVEVDDGKGGKQTMQLDKMGRPVGQALPGYIAPVQVNQGNKISFVKPGAGVSLPVGMSPDSVASNQVAWANAGTARERLNLDQQGGNKAPAGYRYKPDGSMEAIPGGPADLKAQAVAQQKASGGSDVDVALSTLRDAYDRLETGGGITSTKNSALGNLAASTSSSGIGQATGRAFGTSNQSARNDIAMSRPALLAAMMKATGMSAKQMDSNAELKLWLATATDPTLDIESNRRALSNIERKYINGAQPAAPTGLKAGAVDGGYRFKGGNPADKSNWEKVQ